MNALPGRRAVCLLFFATAFLQPPRSASAQVSPPALYMVENVGPVVNTRKLNRISYASDGKLSTEVIGAIDQRFFGHTGGHRIVDDRYLVTPYGGVIDLHTREVIHKFSSGHLHAVDRNKVIYSTSNLNLPPGYYVFDLASAKESKLEMPGRYAMPGVVSPDGTMSVRRELQRSGNMRGPGSVILLETVSLSDRYLDVLPPAGFLGSDSTRPTQDLGHGELNFELSKASADSLMPNVATHPFLWLDDQRILTQRRNGELVVLGIDGSLADLVTVPDVVGSEPLHAPRLFRDLDGRIVYSAELSKDTGQERNGKKVFGWESGDFVIDPVARTATRLSRRSLGNGFEISLAADEQERRTIYKDGKEIGQWKTVLWPGHTNSTPGYLALIYRNPNSKPGDSNGGVAVWSDAQQEWQTVPMWPNDLVGWVTGAPKSK